MSKAINLNECQYCKREVKLVTGDVVYPHRTDLYNNNFWMCEHCDAFVGCHRATLRPLGTVAKKELRKTRMITHNYLDPLWLKGPYKRHDLYNMIAQRLGLTKEECHIALFNEEQCKETISYIIEIKQKKGL